MLDVIPAQRVVRGASTVVSWQPTDADGEPAAPSGVVTVTIARSDGTPIVTAAATTGTGTQPRTYTLTAASTSTLDLLTVSWMVDGVEVSTDRVEIVGGVVATVAQLTALEKGLGNYTSEQIIAARARCEFEWERATHRGMVPRFAVERVSGTGSNLLWLEHPNVRSVAWARASADLSVDTIAPSVDNMVIHSACWPRGVRNIEIGYSYGLDGFPPDALPQFARHVLYRLNQPLSGVADGAITQINPDGSRTEMAVPGWSHFHVGVPDIDAAIKALTWAPVGIA